MPRIYGTVDKDIAKWAENMINSGKFYNMSHLIAQGLTALREKEGEADIDDIVSTDPGAVVQTVEPPDGSGDGGSESESEDPEVQVPKVPED